jgi:hypothetical protein
MLIFIIIASLMTVAGYGNGKYYKACQENEFKGKECQAAKKLSRIKK